MASNVDILTRSHTALKAKARAKKNQIDSIVFDDDARLEFLTGFRKRNLLKKETAKNKAKERERQERLQARKEQRQALKERARENARQIESAFKEGDVDNESDDEETIRFSSSDKGKGKGKGKATQEFEDEEQLATVTIVEEFDPDTLRQMPSTSRSMPGSLPSESEALADVRILSRSRAQKLCEEESVRHSGLSTNQMIKPPAKKVGNQPKKFAYETKSARKAACVKQRARRAEKADLAGGKVRRGESGKGGKRSRKAK